MARVAHHSGGQGLRAMQLNKVRIGLELVLKTSRAHQVALTALDLQQYRTGPRTIVKCTFGHVGNAPAFGRRNRQALEIEEHIIGTALVGCVHGRTGKAKRDLSFGKVSNS